MIPNVLLIGENSSENRRLALALQGAGYRLMSVESLAGARGVFARSSMDLVVVSTELDAKLDLDLVHWLRQQATPINMPILAIAEDCTVQARIGALDAGANDYLSKPYAMDHLVCRISNMLAHRESRPSIAPQGFARRILVVDDSPTYGNALSDALRRDGHDVAFAETGKEALSFIERHKADAVVLDVFLPDISGVDVCRQIKSSERTASLPVLVLTGREKSAVRADATAANADDFAVKSSDFEVIRQKVRVLLVRSPNRKISQDRLNAVIATSASQRQPSGPMPAAPRLEVPPTARKDSSSQMRAAPSIDATSLRQRLEQTASLVEGTRDAAALFDHVVMMTGLSELVARSTVQSVCRRLELDPHALRAEDLPRLIEGLKHSLQLFLPPTEARERLAALNSLAR